MGCETLSKFSSYLKENLCHIPLPFGWNIGEYQEIRQMLGCPSLFDNRPSSKGRAGAVFRWDSRECVWMCVSGGDVHPCPLVNAPTVSGRDTRAWPEWLLLRRVWGKLRVTGWKETRFIIYPSTRFELFTVCTYDPQNRRERDREWK